MLADIKSRQDTTRTNQQVVRPTTAGLRTGSGEVRLFMALTL